MMPPSPRVLAERAERARRWAESMSRFRGDAVRMCGAKGTDACPRCGIDGDGMCRDCVDVDPMFGVA